MNCKKCGHDDPNPIGKCLEEVIDKNVEVTGLDGKKYIEPELTSICACKEPVHYEAVAGFERECELCSHQAQGDSRLCRDCNDARLEAASHARTIAGTGLTWSNAEAYSEENWIKASRRELENER